MKHLIVEVADVKGKCLAGYNLGDKFEINANVCIDGQKICYFAISSIMPAILALQLGNDPKDIGLSKEHDAAYMQCSDPGEPFTGGGIVVFKIKYKF
ncbi:MAG: TIGR04076 family protein [Actinobacteria bacterium]|nr:TIGR04076 family protein [Actinomycetota bacterium]